MGAKHLKSSILNITPHLRTTTCPKRIDAICIGVSTGGPDALNILMESLDSHLTCPIFIVIHMTIGFSNAFVCQLQRRTTLKVCEAEDQMVAQEGHVYIAPSGRHMEIRYNRDQSKTSGMYRIFINDEAEVNSCRPSVDVLFNSAAEICNHNMLGLIMTGIGHDGAAGAANLANKGKGYIVIQDEESSIVWGMPKATLLNNVVNEVLPLSMLGHRINNLVLKGKNE